MTSKIWGFQGKELSYAARHQLVNSVLMSITTYWCQIFVLPKKVIKDVIAVCRAFLWHYDVIQNLVMSFGIISVDLKRGWLGH